MPANFSADTQVIVAGAIGTNDFICFNIAGDITQHELDEADHGVVTFVDGNTTDIGQDEGNVQNACIQRDGQPAGIADNRFIATI